MLATKSKICLALDTSTAEILFLFASTDDVGRMLLQELGEVLLDDAHLNSPRTPSKWNASAKLNFH